MCPTRYRIGVPRTIKDKAINASRKQQYKRTEEEARRSYHKTPVP